MSVLHLEHPITKQIKKAPVGNWNFVVLCLGPIAPLLRGDFKWMVIFCIPFIGAPILQLFGVNSYNFWFIKDQLKKGYKIKQLPLAVTPEALSGKIGMNAKDSMV